MQTKSWKRIVLISASLTSVGTACDHVTCDDTNTCGNEVDPRSDGGRDATSTEAGGTTGGDSAGPDSSGCDGAKSPSDDPCVIDDRFAVFVSLTGNDGNSGTKSAPLRTLTAAIQTAHGKDSHRVIACGGTYGESISLVGATLDFGVSVFGAMSCDGGAWAYDASKTVVIAPPTGHALRADGLEKPISFTDISFTSADRSLASDSSIAIFASNVASLTLRRARVSAGAGAAGQPGATPTGALPTASNGNIGSGGGAAISCPCPNGGTSVGAKGGAPGAPGEKGLPDLDGGTPGTSSAGGCGGGGKGGDAPAATAGVKLDSLGVLSVTGWVPTNGATGVSGGPGQGGGGGGSSDILGGNGGGGACGGCGGAFATAGGGGGASIGLLAFNSSLTLEASVIVTKDAGAGGSGSPGQSGAVGGSKGGLGGASACGGGAGGRGGDGAASGGGAGGVSAGIVWKGGSVPKLDSDTTQHVTIGTAGARGPGGAPGTNDGASGTAVPILAL